jgi:MoaA/NifB/PqqE/SkfB family radical SAM enzyme
LPDVFSTSKGKDDSHIAGEILKMIPLMSPDTKEICLTGGEPTLLGQSLIQIIESFKDNLPHTGIHVLSNGRGFKDACYASSIAKVIHPDLMIGIPIYSDISTLHDHVVQADGAFDDTIRGIINLKALGDPLINYRSHHPCNTGAKCLKDRQQFMNKCLIISESNV